MARIYLALVSVVLFLSCQELLRKFAGRLLSVQVKLGVGSSPINLSGNSPSRRPFGTWMFTRAEPRPKQQKLLAAPSSSLLERFGC